MRANKKRFNRFRRKLPDKDKQEIVPKQYRYLLGQEEELNENSIKNIVKKMKMPRDEGKKFLKNALRAYKVSEKLKIVLKKEIHKINLSNES